MLNGQIKCKCPSCSHENKVKINFIAGNGDELLKPQDITCKKCSFVFTSIEYQPENKFRFSKLPLVVSSTLVE